MFHKEANRRTLAGSVIVFGFLTLALGLGARAAPAIVAINPTKAAPGETVTMFGSELTTEIELRSSGDILQVTGSINQNDTEVAFEVPSNIPAGEYVVAMIAPSGTYFSDTNLTIVVGGKSFKAPSAVRIPTEGLPSFGQLIAMIFTWSLNILGIVVFVMIFFAGFKWFTAAGNTARVNEARSQITNAITGAIILLAAWIILYTINPDLVGGTPESPTDYFLPGIGDTTNQAP